MSHASTAQQIFSSGPNCSVSVYQAFSDVDKVGGTPPAPRSIGGKCGALLAAQRVLEDMGAGRADELERDFAAELGYVKCVDLKRNRVSCNDCVGTAARLVDKYLAQ